MEDVAEPAGSGPDPQSSGPEDNARRRQNEPTFAELEHVHVARGDTVVLHDVNLRIGAGEHVAILGPNGCGKSTLLKTLTCECYPVPGPGMRVRIFGREHWEVAQLRTRLGVVAAELPGPSALITRGLDAVITGFFGSSTIWPHLCVTPAMRDRAVEALHLMEAWSLRDKQVGAMSAGEARRVMIARALVHRPGMLLLDEPSNALDLLAQRELRETLRRVAQQGTGLLLVTHHVADILPEIERVLMLKNGRLFADGPKRELLTAQTLAALFGVPINVTERDGYYHAIA